VGFIFVVIQERKIKSKLFISMRTIISPQNNICPHGRTYLIKAVAMVKNRITTPTDHMCIKLYDP
jgi:hypothetical protein